jgi:hypothetical protein
MIRIIIAGGRHFDDYEFLRDKVSDFILMELPKEYWKPENIEIVSGGAKGADSLGERYAKDTGCNIKRFIPDWSIGKKAGILRNHEMGDYADILLAFHDGESTGTKDMIDYAIKKGLLVEVFTYEPVIWTYFSEEQGNGFDVSFTAFYKQQVKKHSREPVGKKIKITYQEYERGGKN